MHPDVLEMAELIDFYLPTSINLVDATAKALAHYKIGMPNALTQYFGYFDNKINAMQSYAEHICESKGWVGVLPIDFPQFEELIKDRFRSYNNYYFIIND